MSGRGTRGVPIVLWRFGGAEKRRLTPNAENINDKFFTLPLK